LRFGDRSISKKRTSAARQRRVLDLPVTGNHAAYRDMVSSHRKENISVDALRASLMRDLFRLTRHRNSKNNAPAGFLQRDSFILF